MKKLITIIAAVALTANVFAQAPSKMSYQAIVRDAGNALVTSSSIGMRISILQGSTSGTAVYVETQSPATNANGLASIEIGSGTVVSGDFNTIDWTAGPYFIKTETDPAGGSNYSIAGTSQLMSVPYAMYAKTSGSSTPGPQGPQGDPGAQGTQGAQGPQGTQGTAGANGNDGLLPAGSAAGNTPYWDGSAWVTGSGNIYNNGSNVGINTATPGATLDVNGSANVSGNATANSFVVTNGTSTQFLKADGSLDTNTYVTASQQGILSVGQIDNNPNSYGATMNGHTLQMEPATPIYGGIVTPDSQEFAGFKHFYSPITTEGTLTVGNDFSGSGRVNVISNNNQFSDPIGTQLKISSYIKNYVGSNDTIALYSAADIDASFLGAGSPVTFTDATALHLTAPYGGGFINSLALKTDGAVKVNGSVSMTGTLNIGNVTYPNYDGGANQVLMTDGAGTVTWQSISTPTKAAIGLGNVDNTADVDKPVSTATQTAIDLKADLSSPALTGTPTAPTPSAGDNSTQIATTAFVRNAASVKTIVDAQAIPSFTLASANSGNLVTTQWGQLPTFPENLPDGFTCDIINYSLYPWSSNTLATALFVTSITGLSGAPTFNIPSGGTVRITVTTIFSQKYYFVTGDTN